MMKTHRIKRHMAMLALLALTAGCAAISGQETSGEYVDDATISTKARAEILGDSMLKPFQIHVETLQNVVQLSGFVDTPSQKAEAERVVRNIKGVKQGKNDIVVH